ncbi:hypothetical protein [Allokutzneria sp. NRRL B-24872]|uniref:hypothetical protein n=1 Tax=Allokutzneria sp. NRRL B-24872 TaxID=1137961 RepID=UPI00143DE933|nr:hypothetical protein [Allokutzneria sp. NRRL B-24872]
MRVTAEVGADHRQAGDRRDRALEDLGDVRRARRSNPWSKSGTGALARPISASCKEVGARQARRLGAALREISAAAMPFPRSRVTPPSVSSARGRPSGPSQCSPSRSRPGRGRNPGKPFTVVRAPMDGSRSASRLGIACWATWSRTRSGATRTCRTTSSRDRALRRWIALSRAPSSAAWSGEDAHGISGWLASSDVRT